MAWAASMLEWWWWRIVLALPDIGEPLDLDVRITADAWAAIVVSVARADTTQPSNFDRVVVVWRVWIERRRHRA